MQLRKSRRWPMCLRGTSQISLNTSTARVSGQMSWPSKRAMAMFENCEAKWSPYSTIQIHIAEIDVKKNRGFIRRVLEASDDGPAIMRAVRAISDTASMFLVSHSSYFPGRNLAELPHR